MKLFTGSLVIRADAGTVMGTGHIMRGIALGQAWRAMGGRVVFISAHILYSLMVRLRREGFHPVSFRVRAGSRADAEETVSRAKRWGARWIVLDGYHFDLGFRESLRNSGISVLWIDDLGTSGDCYADIVLNQNLYARPTLYPRRTAPTRLLLGTRFALLRKEFHRISRRSFLGGSSRNRLLISGGGTDPHNMTRTVLKALSDIPVPSFDIDVILGGGYRKERTLAGLTPLAGNHRVRLLRNPTNVAALMARADAAVVAAGSSGWEIARVGLPALLVVQAENQAGIARSLERSGAAWNLGSVKKLSAINIQRQLRLLMASRAMRIRMASCGRRLVDGRGARRVVAAMNAVRVA